MSFSLSTTGTPEEVKAAIQAESDRLTDQSKAEFDAIKLALETLVDQQVGNGAVTLSANGHASFNGKGTKTYGSVSVTIKGSA